MRSGTMTTFDHERSLAPQTRAVPRSDLGADLPGWLRPARCTKSQALHTYSVSASPTPSNRSHISNRYDTTASEAISKDSEGNG